MCVDGELEVVCVSVLFVGVYIFWLRTHFRFLFWLFQLNHSFSAVVFFCLYCFHSSFLSAFIFVWVKKKFAEQEKKTRKLFLKVLKVLSLRVYRYICCKYMSFCFFMPCTVGGEFFQIEIGMAVL